MEENKVVLAHQEPRPVEAVFVPEKSYSLARHIAGTVLGILVFATAILLSDASNLRMPGHIVVFWFPALMAGRALSGYRGSGLVISALGGGLVNVYHPPVGADVLGFVLAALVVEGVLLLVRQNPSVVIGIFLGIAADFGKLLPKLAVIMAGGSTPHHNRMTLPYMLASYALFGAVAGILYVVGRYGKRKAAARIAATASRDDSGFVLIWLLLLISILGLLVAPYV